MERSTIEIYERVADEYARRRGPATGDRTQEFVRLLPTNGVRADLGCGPGRHTPHLGAPLVALDASRGMLFLASAAAPGAMLVQGDLEELPFADCTLAGVWSNAAYLHIPRERLLGAFKELRRVLRPAGVAELSFVQGDDEGCRPGDDFPGRFFAYWQPDDLLRLVSYAELETLSIEIDRPTAGWVRLLLRRP